MWEEEEERGESCAGALLLDGEGFAIDVELTQFGFGMNKLYIPLLFETRCWVSLQCAKLSNPAPDWRRKVGGAASP